jgi:hypothetical protein
MCDEPEHKSLFEIIEDQIGRCLPDRLRNDKEFVHSLGSLCGFIAGCIVGKKVVEWLFPRGDDK